MYNTAKAADPSDSWTLESVFWKPEPKPFVPNGLNPDLTRDTSIPLLATTPTVVSQILSERFLDDPAITRLSVDNGMTIRVRANFLDEVMNLLGGYSNITVEPMNATTSETTH